MDAQNPQKFRLRLNLFDTVILILALVIGAVILLFSAGEDVSALPDSNTTTATYTIRLQNAVPQITDQAQVGDALEDAVRNLNLGNVVSATYNPSPLHLFDEETQRFVVVDSPDYVDMDIVVSCPASLVEDAITLSSGYAIRSGQSIYVRGPGYMGSGIILSIDRAGLA